MKTNKVLKGTIRVFEFMEGVARQSLVFLLIVNVLMLTGYYLAIDPRGWIVNEVFGKIIGDVDSIRRLMDVSTIIGVSVYFYCCLAVIQAVVIGVVSLFPGKDKIIWRLVYVLVFGFFLVCFEKYFEAMTLEIMGVIAFLAILVEGLGGMLTALYCKKYGVIDTFYFKTAYAKEKFKTLEPTTKCKKNDALSC